MGRKPEILGRGNRGTNGGRGKERKFQSDRTQWGIGLRKELK